MKRPHRIFQVLAVLSLFTLCGSFPANARAQASNNTITARDAEIDGAELHYITSGHGPTVILLHGYAEMSRMWRPIIPRLAERFTVIAPDLPGIGDSAIPANGLDMKSAAIRIHSLARSLNVQKASVVGHDIGLMVAYAYAAQFPAEVEKLVVMDAFLPGVAGWEDVYNNPANWHFRFNGLTPEALVKGRERIYFEHYWNDFAPDKTHSIPEPDRAAYTAAYSRPGRMRSGWAYFVTFPQAAKDFALLSQTKLTMPVLSIGGEKSLGDVLGRQMKLVATNVKVIVLKNTGHWILEENPKETTGALVDFL
jgi:pimeloyl-ACP methyl ester carboxylesterase